MPYSKWQSLTVSPSGFTVAFSVAEVCVTAEAASVTTVGAPFADEHPRRADVVVVAGAADQRGVAFGGQRHARAERAFADSPRRR